MFFISNRPSSHIGNDEMHGGCDEENLELWMGVDGLLWYVRDASFGSDNAD